jgi:hypothetical protein
LGIGNGLSDLTFLVAFGVVTLAAAEGDIALEKGVFVLAV